MALDEPYWQPFRESSDPFIAGHFWTQLAVISQDGTLTEKFDMSNPDVVPLILACVNGPDNLTYFILTDLEKWIFAHRPSPLADNTTTVDPHLTEQVYRQAAGRVPTVCDCAAIKDQTDLK